MDFVADAVDFVVDTVDFVARVYGANAPKVNRVEFNFVASVYRA